MSNSTSTKTNAMSGELKNLSDGNAQALQALLHSLTPDAMEGTGGKLSTSAVEKLSARLTELMGDDSAEPLRRNENGQLLNEEGLPIIEIMEQVSTSNLDASPAIIDEEAPVSLAAPNASEQERRRRERDRILDMLEEEERLELGQDSREEMSQEQRQEILRKRKQAAEDERARLKAAKDMQRKMGKALLRDATQSHDETTPSPAPTALPSTVVQSEIPDSAHKAGKKVTFSDDSNAEAGPSQSREMETLDWGDVVPARLRASSGQTMLPGSLPEPSSSMKMHVVERFPGKPPQETQPDSDDESEPPSSPTIADSDEEAGSESGEDLVEEADLDFAQHQREIALEYHEKRAKMLDNASDVIHSQLPSNETAANQSSRKPAISHFQANRLAASYNSTSPSSKFSDAHTDTSTTAQTFQRAIRMGKLDADNRLVGGDAGESGSDEEDNAAVQELTELLSRGDVYNLGPDGSPLHSKIPVASSSEVPPFSTPQGPPPSAKKSSASKFKLAHSGRAPVTTPLSPNDSRSATPISQAVRSSPKLLTPTDEAIPPPTNFGQSSPMLSTVVETPPASSATIIESPSFLQSRRPQQPPTVIRAADKPAKVSRFLAERM
ncbi:hypothetical protein R3P38DRAFT_2903623 [Favolaschia claudopus]|uniref:DUF3835 domain-containing protein n=1 Tax=Favolaschia claudopus TaxID=2862362 RepID=A0AAW0CDZ4_9AGAR